MPSVRPSRFRGHWSLLVFLACVPDAAQAQWWPDGNLVAGPASAPHSPVLLPGASATFFAAWVDGRTGYNTDVRATRWTFAAAPYPGWLADGNPVTNITCRKYSLAGAGDASGGVTYAWSDDRCSSLPRRIHVLKLTPGGTRATGWPADGVRIAPTTSNQFDPAIVTDAGGGSFVAWQDFRDGRPQAYLQRLAADGTIAAGWPSTGRAVAPSSRDQGVPQLVLDGAGGVYVAWVARNPASDDIVLQRITSAGAVASGWSSAGVTACNASGNQSELVMVADGAAGAYLAWRDPRTGNDDIRAVRITSSGAVAAGWTAGGSAITTAAGEQSRVRIARDGSQGLLLAWQDRRGATWDVYALRLTGSGAPAAGWSTGGLAIAATAQDELAPAIDGDGAGGAWLAWQVGAPGAFDLSATRVGPDGAPAAGWRAGGTTICAAPGDQQSPVLRNVGGDGILLWLDFRAGATASLQAQRLRASGPLFAHTTNLAASHRDGQTFLTWTPPSDTGWTYRVYRRGSPITGEADLTDATLLGSVGDSSATDRRLSMRTGSVASFRTDSAAAPLAPAQGLFVVTVAQGRTSWYAVTAQARGHAEDRRIVPGSNALASGVEERVALPRPVYQGTRACGPVVQHVYTLWTWNTDTPLYPAMSNRPSQPFDCGVTMGPPNGPAFVRPHARGGAFTDNCRTTGEPSEWVLAIDDYTTNQDMCTYYYGHHPDYDPASNTNPVPSSGSIVDYTHRRMLHTIDWWRRTFAFDPTRHYAFGYSLGGTYSMHLALAHPERFAAAMSVVGKVDFSFETEPDPTAMFNTGQPARESLSRLWGTTSANLPTTDGIPVYAMVNDGALAAMTADRGDAFIVNFAGRNDRVVGWMEKIAFYQSLDAHHRGGIQYWDNRDHTGAGQPSAFAPMMDLPWLYRFRTDLSWPAFSSGSLDGDPGNGWPASGDTVGTMNGYLDWDPAVTDSATSWQVTLTTRAMTTLWKSIAPPESVTVDVTPRRLQRFRPTAGVLVSWKAVRAADGAQVQSGVVAVDATNRITVPGVKVYRLGTRLVLAATSSWLETGPAVPGPLAFTHVPNPMRGRGTLALHWPVAGEARLELFDALGRRARELWRGPVDAGPWSVGIESGSLAPGLYHLRATQAGRSATRRLVFLH